MNAIDLLENWLKANGCRNERDDEGNLIFRYEKRQMIVFKDSEDCNFLRICIPSIYEVDGDREKCLEAINTISRRIKVIKAFLVDDQLWLSVEALVDSTQNTDNFIERYLDILIEGYKSIAKEILS